MTQNSEPNMNQTQVTVIRAMDRGIQPDTHTDSGPSLRALLSECQAKGPTKIVLAPGRYDFFAAGCEEKSYSLSNTAHMNPRRCALVLRDLEDVQLCLRGVDMRCHGRLMPITIDRCRRVTVEGGSIDWDQPLTAQAKVLVATQEVMELQIDPRQHPLSVEDGCIVFAAEGWRSPLSGIMEFDSTTGHIPPGSGDRCPGPGWHCYRAEHLGDGLVRMQGRFLHPPQAGNMLVLRHGPRDHAGVFIVGSRDVAIRDLGLHHTSGLGILCQHSENLDFSGVQIVPSAGRYFAGHDDGIHVSNCRGYIQINGCRFAGLMDDPVNVHGTAVRIVDRLASDRLRCRFMHHESVGMPFAGVGDTVSFLNRKTLGSQGTAQVREVETWDLFTFDIAFDRPVPGGMVVDDALENLTWAPDLTIRDSFFGCCRARGLLISTPGRVIIEGNTFESSGSAILIPGDANYWYETGAVRDVLIRGNHFADICNTSDYQFTEGIISIFPEVPHPDPARPFHRNIRIEENEFVTGETSVLHAYSVEELTFRGNRIIRSHRFPSRGEHRHMVMHEHDWGDGRQHMITLDHCREVTVADNVCEGEVVNREVALLSTSSEELTLDPKDGLTVVAGGAGHGAKLRTGE